MASGVLNTVCIRPKSVYKAFGVTSSVAMSRMMLVASDDELIVEIRLDSTWILQVSNALSLIGCSLWSENHQSFMWSVDVSNSLRIRHVFEHVVFECICDWESLMNLFPSNKIEISTELQRFKAPLNPNLSKLFGSSIKVYKPFKSNKSKSRFFTSTDLIQVIQSPVFFRVFAALTRF